MDWLTGDYNISNLLYLKAFVRPSSGGFKLALNFNNLNQKRVNELFPEYRVLSIPSITIECSSGNTTSSGNYLITSDVPFLGFSDDNSIISIGAVNLKPEEVSKSLMYNGAVKPDRWNRMREIVKKFGVLELKLLISFSLMQKLNYLQSHIYLLASEIVIKISKVDLEEFIGIWVKSRDSTIGLSDNLPEPVLMDLLEASKCIDIEASKAAVVMSRRALQNALLSKGVDKALNLYKQIDFLKENNMISNDVASLADGVRYLGNFGAHPDDDLLNSVDLDDAKLAYQVVLKILKQLFPAD